MIITRTPYRVSFMGGGTDYPAFFRKHGGAVLTSTIDYYCHVLLRRLPPFLDTRYRLTWSKTENVDDVADIEHPGIRGCLRHLALDIPLEVIHVGDLPARSGLGSSSAFVVGMLHALQQLQDRKCSRTWLARAAITVEQVVLRETVGIQDQIACTWGGFNHITFSPTGWYTVSPVETTQAALRALESSLLLVYTGVQRYASDIAATQVDNVDRRETELLALRDLVEPACTAVQKGQVERFGCLLDEAWTLKRQLSDKVSSAQIDSWYATARRHGAWGGKVIGAGGGGFLLLCAPSELHSNIVAGLGLPSIPFCFSHRGSEVVHSG